jgi:hypothetical protein
LIVVSIPGVTPIGMRNNGSRRPFGQSKKIVIPAFTGSRVRVNRPNESVRSDGSSIMTPLLIRRRTRILKFAIALPVSASVTTPCTRRGL